MVGTGPQHEGISKIGLVGEEENGGLGKTENPDRQSSE